MNLKILALGFTFGFATLIPSAKSQAAVIQYTYDALAPQIQTLDFYAASRISNQTLPLVVFIHGGAWIAGDKKDYGWLGEFFAEHKINCAVINYRLSTPDNQAHYPDPVQDAAAAVKWVRKHADELGVDTRSIFIMGHSAGAYITALLGVNDHFLPNAKAIAGFIGLEGIYDLPALAKTFPNYAAAFLNAAFGAEDKAKKNWVAASPQFAKLSLHRPWLLVHSNTDEMVNQNQTTAFYQKLHKNSEPVQMISVENKKHAQVLTEISQPENGLGKTILSFVNSEPKQIVKK